MALVALVLMFHARLVLAGPGHIIDTPDILLYFQWLHRFAREELLAGRLPLWNPYIFAGTPFAANPQATVFYPPAWLYLIVDVAMAQRLLIVVHVMAASVFMFLFLRVLRIAGSAAFIGTLPFVLGNYVMAKTAVGHLTMLFALAWLPLVMLLWVKFLRERRWQWAVAAGAAMGMQLLAGEPQTSYYTALLMVIYALVGAVNRSEETVRPPWIIAAARIAGGLAIVAAVALGVAAVQLLPTAEMAMQSDRHEATYEFATRFSVPADGLIEFIMRWHDGGAVGLALGEHGPWFRLIWESAGYAGIFTLILAGVSLVLRGNPALLSARVALVIGIVLMLGRYTPVYAVLYEFLPGFKFFRIPARAVILAHWSLSVMAAFGANYILAEGAARWRLAGWRVAGASGALTVLAGLLIAGGLIGVHRIETSPGEPPALAQQLALSHETLLRPMLCAGGALVVLGVLGRLPRAIAVVVIGALIAGDLYISKPRVNLKAYDVQRDPTIVLLRDIATSDNIRVHPFRVDLPPDVTNANAAMSARIENVNGYAPMTLGRFYRFVHHMRRQPVSQFTRHELPAQIYRGDEPFALRILNVWSGFRWNHVRQRFEPATDRFVNPRAWVVDRAELFDDDEAALARLQDWTFDPMTSVILHGPPSLQPVRGMGPIGYADFRRLSPREAEITTQTGRDGYLVLSEVYYPGWRAELDGRPVALQRANYFITAMPLPAGNHRILYRYQPTSVTVGAWISIATLLTLLTAGAWAGRAGWMPLPKRSGRSGTVCQRHAQ